MRRVGLARHLLLFTACIAFVAMLMAEPAQSAVAGHNAAVYVGHPSKEVTLESDGRRVGLDGVVRVRVNNSSSREVAYGYEYQLARFKDGLWVNLKHRPVFSPRVVLMPDSKGHWQKIVIPRQAEPGLYRVQKRIELGEAPQGKERTIKATFRVGRR